MDKKPDISKINVIQKILEEHMTYAFVIIHCSKANESKILEKLEQTPDIIEDNILVQMT